MGSGQSTTSHKDTNKKNKNTFAIDLDARGDQPNSGKKQKKKKRGNSNRKNTTDPSQEAKMAEASQQQQQQPLHQASAGIAPLAAAMAEFSEVPSGAPQLVVLNTIPKAQPKHEEDSFSLNELDAILERMKAKYRPSPVQLSGKSRGVFEEIEQNLVNCYSKHKDQPLECSKLTREYTAFVFEQRNRILRDATRKDSPIYT